MLSLRDFRVAQEHKTLCGDSGIGHELWWPATQTTQKDLSEPPAILSLLQITFLTCQCFSISNVDLSMDFDDSQVSHRRTLHLLLYRALLDIRHEGRKHGYLVIAGLADLLHLIPINLERAANGEIDYSDAFQSLNEKADEMHCSHWIDDQLKNLNEAALQDRRTPEDS